ncbi:hypothetical protein CJ030_MR3G001296 [Morella rubra]|uniref:Uncharacterized protein n=1 Tax=Morella rubra TaxID=262757 RepID=A0A6A1W1Z4_9ROSI|nr:hypothetical protein CJ030_MR3G001296 [Morella rubra]
MECDVAFPDFEEMKFEDRSIGIIIDDWGWISYLKRTDTVPVDMVLEFYAAVLDVADNNAPFWHITLRGGSFQFSVDVLAAYIGAGEHQPMPATSVHDAGESLSRQAQTELPACADSWMKTIDPTHQLCIDLDARLTTLEKNYVLLDSKLKEEVAIMRKDSQDIVMAAGKKCLRCNSGSRVVVAASHSQRASHDSPSPVTSQDIVMVAGEKYLRCNLGSRVVIAASPSQGVSSDSPSPVTVSPLPPKVVVRQHRGLNKYGASLMLPSHISLLVRSHVPLDEVKWSKFSDELSSSIDLVWRLEEARVEIEEMRARQMEYEKLLVQRSEMEKTM